MNVATRTLEVAPENPASHAAEIAGMLENNARSHTRLQQIALIYSRGIDGADYSATKYGELLFQLKLVRERFQLSTDLTIARAIKALEDPMGW